MAVIGNVPLAYDDISFGYTGSDLTSITYTLNGKVVKTINLTWDAGKVTEVESVFPVGKNQKLTLTYDGDNIGTVAKTEV